MGKKSKKNKRKTELKVIFFIILIAAALFIVSTYAWFSTQRDVSIMNLKGKVEVAEGLEISLDAINWKNEIVLDDETNIIDSAYTGHNNISPKEMLPVSTLGKITAMTGEKAIKNLKMIRGKITNNKELSKIVFMDESLAAPNIETAKHDSENEKYPGYFAFDVFLKNSSKTTEADVLQLNNNASVQIITSEEGGNEAAGLQNTVRVGFARYGSYYADGAWVGTADVMEQDQQKILKQTGASATGDTVYITDVAIWEPNAASHVNYIVNNNNNITWTTGSNDEKNYKLNLKNKYLEDNPGDNDGAADYEGKTGFWTNTQLPTYALKETAVDAKSENVIDDIYYWSTDETTLKGVEYLEKQTVLQTTKKSATDYTPKEGVEDLVSTDGSSKFTIAPSKISRLRIYVWLEGQDVDCINYASYGGGIIVNIGLVKGEDPEADNPAAT